nr:uncharacterized protein LOC117279269 [Nicotiana tomentosiformis]
METQNKTEETNLQFLSCCLVGAFNDSFCHNPSTEVLQKWFTSQWSLTAGPRVSSLAHSLLLFELSSSKEAERVKFGDWFWNGIRLSLDWWSPVLDLKISEQISGHRWIRAFGIPLHEWYEKILKFIGDECGGYIDSDEDTKKKSNLLWARICIKDSDSEPPCKIDLAVGDMVFEISIILDGHVKIAGDGKGRRSHMRDQRSKELNAMKSTPVDLKFESNSQAGPSHNPVHTKANNQVNFHLLMGHHYYSKEKKGKRPNSFIKKKKLMEWRATGRPNFNSSQKPQVCLYKRESQISWYPILGATLNTQTKVKKTQTMKLNSCNLFLSPNLFLIQISPWSDLTTQMCLLFRVASSCPYHGMRGTLKGNI